MYIRCYYSFNKELNQKFFLPKYHVAAAYELGHYQYLLKSITYIEVYITKF